MKAEIKHSVIILVRKFFFLISFYFLLKSEFELICGCQNLELELEVWDNKWMRERERERIINLILD